MSNDRDQAPNAGQGRALVAVAPVAARANRESWPSAAFVMQLIACHHQFEAYRSRRRISAAEALSRYGMAPHKLARAALDRSL